MSDGDSPLECIGIEKIGSKPRNKEFYPFAYSLLDSSKSSHCWTCLQEYVELACENCKIAQFCSKTCQTSGEFDHKYECDTIRNCPELGIEERMLLRIIGRYKDIEAGNDLKIENFYLKRESKRTIMELWHHTKDVKNDALAMRSFLKIYEKLVKVAPKERMVEEEVAFELHCRNFINRHSISNSDYLREIGKGLYLDLCRYDHSCRPNAIYSCNGTVALLRGLHDNVDLENVETTHYTYIELPPCKIQRRHMLKETWYFECNCERCTDPVDNWLTSIICSTCINANEYRKSLKIHGVEAYANLETMEIICDRCHTTVDREHVYAGLEAMRTIRHTLDTVENHVKDPTEMLKIFQGILISFERILPMSNSYFCQLIAAMIPLVQQVNMTRKEKLITTLDLHSKCEPFVRYVYRYAHPSKAMHFLQMGQIHLELGNGKEAARYLVEAHRIMDYLFDQNHYLNVHSKKLMDTSLSHLKQFKRNFINILDQVPEAKQALQEKLMMPEERIAKKDAEKKPSKKNKKNKNKKTQKNTSNKLPSEDKKPSFFDDLGDLPELVADL